MPISPRGGSGGGGGSSPGGGSGTPATLSGNTVEILYDNRPSTETALTQTAGAANWSKTFDLDLGRALTEADDDKDIRVCFSYTQQTAGRTVDLFIKARNFRSWTEFTTSTAVSTGLPVGNQKFPISRGVSNTNDLNNAWNRQGMVFRRGDSADGNHVLGVVIPAGDNNSGYVAISAFRAVVELVPRVDSLTVSGGGGGGGIETFLGLPDPGDYDDGTIIVNRADRREYIKDTDTFTDTAGTTTLYDLDGYYIDGDANLRIFHDLPATVAASDDDTWIYIDSGAHRDKFYFGDTAPGGTYAWYEDSPKDALREVCLAFVDDATTIGSLTNLGADADVAYLGQFQDEADIGAFVHRHSPVLSERYYVAWNIQEAVFQVLGVYAAPGTVTNHPRWRNIRAEAINPILRPNLDGSFPLATEELFEENAALLDWKSQGWYIQHEQHGTTQSARGTWTGYGPGDSVPALSMGGTYRGVVDNLGQVTAPSNDEVALVSDGRHVTPYVYFTGTNGGWFQYNPSPFDRMLGAFHSLEEADGAVGTFDSGVDTYCVVGYRLHRLTAFTPGTVATHRYIWAPAARGNPTFYFWGPFQNARWPSTFPDSTGDSTRKVEWRGLLAGDVHREEYGARIASERPMFLSVSDVSSDIDSLSPTTTAHMVFTLPAGRWNLQCWFSEENNTPENNSSLSLRRITSGTDDVEVIEALPNSLGSGVYPLYEFNYPDLVTDGTEQFYVRISNTGGEDSRQWFRCEKVG